MAEVLTPLAEATELLTTESVPAAGAVYYLLKELAQELAVTEAPEAPETQNPESDGDSDSHEAGLDVPDPTEYDSPVVARLKRMIWAKMQTRFSLQQDGQPETSVCQSCPLLISAFCDPRYLLFSIYCFQCFVIK